MFLGSLLVAVLVIGLAPAATAGPLSVHAEVGNVSVDYRNNSIDCANAPFSTSPAVEPRVYSRGRCDVNAEGDGPFVVGCVLLDFSTHPMFSFRAYSHGDCKVYVESS